MAKKYDDDDSPGVAEDAETQEYGLEDIAGMKQEPVTDWVNGYVASDLADANSPNYPGNQVWVGVGGNTELYKKDWKEKPSIFPYGQNFAGGGLSRGEKK